jgi:hypothetical protein
MISSFRLLLSSDVSFFLLSTSHDLGGTHRPGPTNGKKSQRKKWQKPAKVGGGRGSRFEALEKNDFVPFFPLG